MCIYICVIYYSIQTNYINNIPVNVSVEEEFLIINNKVVPTGIDK